VVRTGVICALWCAAALGAVGPASGQHRHDHPDGRWDQQPIISPVSYIFRAQVIPESTLVRAAADIEYRNLTDDTAYVVAFSIPGEFVDGDEPFISTCHIDSILYFGAPLTVSEMDLAGSVLRVTIPGGLPPGRRGSFFMTFETRLPDRTRRDDQLELDNWFPRMGILIGPAGLYPRGTEAWTYADYSVELVVDSAWSAALPGVLINDKIHFGLLPKGEDTVLVDLLANHSLRPDRRRYTPIFDNGRKDYYIRARHVTGFPVVLGRSLVYDQVIIDSTKITVCYPPRLRAIWAGWMAREAADFARSFSRILGHLPQAQVTITAGNIGPWNQVDVPMIVLPDDTVDRQELREALAVEIARLWFGRAERENQLLYGLAAYVAMTSDPSVGDCERYGRNLEYWLPGVSRYIFRTTPGWLRILSAMLGPEAVHVAIAEYAARSRVELLPDSAMLDIIAERAAATARFPDPDDAAEMLATLNLAISDIALRRAAGGETVTFRVRHNSSFDLPIELGLIDDRGDTLFSVAGVRPGHANENALLEFVCPRRISAVVVDPHYQYPDINRFDNYWFARQPRFKFHPLESVFPPYCR